MPVSLWLRQHELMGKRAVYPGSFNPLTIAHLAIASKAREVHELAEVHLMVSKRAIGKPTPPGPSFERRIEIITADISAHPWLTVQITEDRLIADIAAGYDVVIMGADKWEQVVDERYYTSAEARDAAVAGLPDIIVAERSGSVAPSEYLLKTDKTIRKISSTRARAGKRELMAPEAAANWFED